MSEEVQITVSEIRIGANDVGRERVALQVINLVPLVVDFDSESEVSSCCRIVGVDEQVASVFQTVEHWLTTRESGIPPAELVLFVLITQLWVFFFQHFINIPFDSGKSGIQQEVVVPSYCLFGSPRHCVVVLQYSWSVLQLTHILRVFLIFLFRAITHLVQKGEESFRNL